MLSRNTRKLLSKLKKRSVKNREEITKMKVDKNFTLVLVIKTRIVSEGTIKELLSNKNKNKEKPVLLGIIIFRVRPH